MAEKLFNYLIKAYEDRAFVRNITLSKYDAKTFDGKVDVLPKDVDAIAEALCFNVERDAYELFKRYINHDSIVYDANTVHLIKNNIKLLPYALEDITIPNATKKELEDFIKLKRIKNRVVAANYDIKMPKSEYKNEDDGFYAPLELKTDGKTKALIMELQEKMVSKTISFDEIQEALKLSPQVNDKEFKKALFAYVDEHCQFGAYASYPLKYALAHEQDSKMLEYIFENHEQLLYQGYSYDGDYTQTVIYAIQDHPLMNEKMAETLAKGMEFSSYINDKTNATIGSIVAKFGKLTERDYEYFCEGLRYTNHRYDANRYTITKAILQSSKTPLKYLRKLNTSLDVDDRTIANIATKIKGITTPKEYENIITNIIKRDHNKIELLNNETKKAIYNAITQTYQEFKRIRPSYKFDNPFEIYKPLLAILRQDNELMPEFNQYYLSYLEEKTRCMDDFERLYLIEKELEKSKEYRYVMIERGLWKGIEEKDLIDDILSEEPSTPISFTTSMEEKEKEI